MCECHLRSLSIRRNRQPGKAVTAEFFMSGPKFLVLLCVGSLFAGCATSRVAQVSTSGRAFNIATYGAVNDPTVDSTTAFRKAIAACHTAGGGTVLVPAGIYLTGPLDLVDNMTLHLDRHATVLFTTN